MPAFDQTIEISATKEEVWQQLQTITNAEKIHTNHPPDFLSVRHDDDVYFIYQLVAMQATTRLRFVITRDTTVEGISNAVDIEQALNELPAEAIETLETEDIQEHLQDIKTLAEKAAQPINPLPKDKNQPQPYQGPVLFSFVSIWTPFLIVGGLFGAAILLAVNWSRLGHPRKAVSTVATILVGWVLILLLMIVILARLGLYTDTAFYLGGLLAGIGFLYWQIRQQKPHYDRWTQQTGIQPNVWQAGCITQFFAIIAGLGLSVMLLLLLPGIIDGFAGFYSSVQPYQHYEDETIRINYPSNWQPTQNYDEFCGRFGANCLVTVADETWGGSLALVRLDNIVTFLTPLQGYSNTIWNNTKSSFSAVVGSDEPVAIQVDGRKGLRRDFTFMTEGQQMGGTYIVFQDNNNLIRLEMYYPLRMRNVIDTVVDSVHFNED